MTRLIVVLLFIAGMTQLAWGSKSGPDPDSGRGPSTALEREKVVELAEFLEQEPLSDKAQAARKWLLTWTIEVPDITVHLCVDLLAPIIKSEEPYSKEIVFQQIFSSAAYIIQNPDKANDKVAIYIAGIEGSLKVYESIREQKPEVRYQLLDELLEKRKSGTLREHIPTMITEECK